MEYKVYILFSEKLNRFYIGSTADLEKRIYYHHFSENRKFTHKANDWIIFFLIDCHSNQQALLIEKHIKNMKSKIYIENLKKYPELVQNLLKKYNLK